MELWKPDKIEGYEEIERWLDSLRVKSESSWIEAIRWYCTNDLYYLHRYGTTLGKAVHSTYGTYLYHHQLYVDACRQYERQLGYGSSLDCSSRRSGKSEIRSTTIPIFLILNNPDIAIFIFSVQKDLAQRHLRRLMGELERNKFLMHVFDDILWTDPRKMAKEEGLVWSVSDGICVKGRSLNRSIQTVEVHALFGGGPIGTGPDVIIADDIERRDRIGTEAAIEELDTAFSEAVTLLTPVVLKQPILVVSNTRFSPNGLVQRLKDRYLDVNPDKVRQYAAELMPDEWPEDMPEIPEEEIGPLGGKIQYPYTKEFLQFKYDESEDKAEYALQYALTYKHKDKDLDLKLVQWYDHEPTKNSREMNSYICIDPSRGVHDPTAIWVWGLTHDKRKVCLDLSARRTDVTTKEFHDLIFNMVSKWTNLSNQLCEVRVEDTPSSTWSELVERELRTRGSYVPVVKVRVNIRQMSGKFKSGKNDRIYSRWNPMLSRGEVWLPKPLSTGGRGIMEFDDKGKYRCLVDYFINVEANPFPNGKFDDLLDAGGMIEDEKTNQDRPLQYPSDPNMRYDSTAVTRLTRGYSWMSA